VQAGFQRPDWSRRGFYNRTNFGGPLLLREPGRVRGRYADSAVTLLEVPHPSISLARYGRGDVIDLPDVLTFDDARYEAIMPRSLSAFCRRFGADVLDPFSSSDIAAAVREDRWADVEHHGVDRLDDLGKTSDKNAK